MVVYYVGKRNFVKVNKNKINEALNLYVIKSIIEFTIKYHVPFLFIEFIKDFLKILGVKSK